MLITISKGYSSDSFDIQGWKAVPDIPRAAIYTVWTKNPSTGQYPLLYIGESGDLGQRISTDHHKYNEWVRNVIDGLYIGYKLMPTTLYSKEERFAEESRLINLYNKVVPFVNTAIRLN